MVILTSPLFKKESVLKELKEIKPEDADLENDMLFAQASPDSNLRKPLGIIHDERGEPILMKGEHIIYSTRSSKYISSFAFFQNFPWPVKRIFLRAGEGRIFLTNRRIIYILVKRHSRDFYTSRRGVGILAAWRWDKENNRDCFSMPLKHMENLRTKLASFLFPGGDGFLVEFNIGDVKYLLSIYIASNKMELDVEKDFFFLIDILKEQTKRIQEGRPDLKPVVGDIAEYKFEKMEKEDDIYLFAVKSERCPSCKYEFTYETIVPKDQKTAEIVCPRCSHAYNKRIAKKMLTKVDDERKTFYS